jgi:hypothetical protein
MAESPKSTFASMVATGSRRNWSRHPAGLGSASPARPRQCGAAVAAAPAVAQVAMPGQFKGVKALAFDAYGTLFDVFSVTALCEQLTSSSCVSLTPQLKRE